MRARVPITTRDTAPRYDLLALARGSRAVLTICQFYQHG